MNFLSTVFSKYKNQLWLTVFSLLWLMVFALLTQMPHQEIIYPDSHSYQISADNLYNHFRGHNFRPLLMAAINGIPYMFGGTHASIFDFAVFVNILCWIGSILAVRAILAEFLSRKYAFYISLSVIFILGNVALIFHLLTEPIYVLMAMVSFWLLMRYEKTRNFRFLAVALSLILLTMLIRPGALVFAVCIVLYYIRPLIYNIRSRWQLFTGGALLLIIVQCAGMKYQFGNFTLSYIDTVTYYNYLGSKAAALRDGIPFSQENNPRTSAIYPLSGPGQKVWAAADFKDQLFNNTRNLFLAYADNVLENSKTGSTAIADCKNVRNRRFFASGSLFFISKWQNRFLSLAGLILGLFFLFRRGESHAFRVMAFYILCTLFLSGISCAQGDRFHLVTFPVVVILAARWLFANHALVRRYAAPLQKGWHFLP